MRILDVLVLKVLLSLRRPESSRVPGGAGAVRLHCRKEKLAKYLEVLRFGEGDAQLPTQCSVTRLFLPVRGVFLNVPPR